MLETILLLEIEKEAKADYVRRALQVFQRLLAIYYLRRSRFCNVQVALKGPPTLWDALGSAVYRLFLPTRFSVFGAD